jgi:DNA invertase Pin-like site-specific DNA recombinase
VLESAAVVKCGEGMILIFPSEDLDRLGRAVAEGIQRIYGVERTTTCLIMGSAQLKS